MKMSCAKAFLLHWLCVFAANGISKVKFNGISDCKNSVDGKGSWTGNFKEDSASLDFSIDIPFDITEENLFKMIAHEYNPDEDEWKYDKQQEEGEICLYMKQFLSKAWEKVRDSSNPKIEQECLIPKGSYYWTDLQLDKDDVLVPVTMIGKRYKLDITPYNEDDEAVFCVQVDVDTYENE